MRNTERKGEPGELHGESSRNSYPFSCPRHLQAKALVDSIKHQQPPSARKEEDAGGRKASGLMSTASMQQPGEDGLRKSPSSP